MPVLGVEKVLCDFSNGKHGRNSILETDVKKPTEKPLNKKEPIIKPIKRRLTVTKIGQRGQHER